MRNRLQNDVIKFPHNKKLHVSICFEDIQTRGDKASRKATEAVWYGRGEVSTGRSVQPKMLLYLAKREVVMRRGKFQTTLIW